MNSKSNMSLPRVPRACASAFSSSNIRCVWPFNPIVSNIGSLLPQIVSGSAIVSIVLGLPTTGPLLLRALIAQDTYAAASMLLMLSVLTVFGVFLSDLLLLWLDPRIRYEKGN